jgi:IS5 family transposase
VLAIVGWGLHTEGVQGTSKPNPELLDAAALCRQLVPEGSVEAFLADHRRELFPDEAFADLFPSERGRPSVPADVIAVVLVLQALEGLSDREAARALADRISWKVASGLALDDPGIHYSVLTYWRTRLRSSERPERIFEAVRAVIDATGVLAGRTRRALDSTVLDDAVATQDTVTQLVSAIRRVRRVVSTAAAVEVSAHDYDAAGKPRCAWDDPEARDALVTSLVNDARAVLEAIPSEGLTSEQADAVGLLALVAGQDVEPGDEEGTWRIARGTVKDRVISTVDPEARHAHKSVSVRRDGYKAHVAVEPDTGLITACRLTPANAPDGATGLGLLAHEPSGTEVVADSAYGSGAVRAALRAADQVQTIKPIPLRVTIPGGFDRDDFALDHTAGTATCPAGHTVRITATGRAVFKRHCRSCPLRTRCTRARQGMSLTITEHDAELVAARRRATEADFLRTYRAKRALVERALAWLVASGHRRVRFRGVERNQLGLSMRVAAINLRRLVNLGLGHDSSWVLAT